MPSGFLECMRVHASAAPKCICVAEPRPGLATGHVCHRTSFKLEARQTTPTHPPPPPILPQISKGTVSKLNRTLVQDTLGGSVWMHVGLQCRSFSFIQKRRSALLPPPPVKKKKTCCIYWKLKVSLFCLWLGLFPQKDLTIEKRVSGSRVGFAVHSFS